MDRTADIARMRTQMERDVPETERDKVVLKSEGRTLTSNQMMKEVEDQTPLGIKLLDSFTAFQATGVFKMLEGWDMVEP